jgi:hypothetical protein
MVPVTSMTPVSPTPDQKNIGLNPLPSPSGSDGISAGASSVGAAGRRCLQLPGGFVLLQILPAEPDQLLGVVLVAGVVGEIQVELEMLDSFLVVFQVPLAQADIEVEPGKGLGIVGLLVELQRLVKLVGLEVGLGLSKRLLGLGHVSCGRTLGQKQADQCRRPLEDQMPPSTGSIVEWHSSSRLVSHDHTPGSRS